MTKYASEQSRGVDANVLSVLGKQITAAAKLLGQNVTLPRAPASSGAEPAPPVAFTAPYTSKVNLTA
jgi:hypothetical protein